MSPPKEFRWGRDGSPPELRPHSEAKLRVFRHYLRRYLDILTLPRQRRELKLTIVDGFAGGGYFDFQGGEVSGSPLVILEEIEAAKRRINLDRQNPVELSIRAYFVEKHEGNVKALTSRLWREGYGPRIGGDIEICHGSIEHNINRIQEDIARHSPRSGRAIFLLDQTGYTSVELTLARSILDRFERAEIILTWAVDWLIDFLSRTPEFAKAALGTGIDSKLLNELLGMKEQRHARHLIQNRLALHLKRALGDPFFTIFFIKPSDSHRSLWLVHASKHPTARNEMVGTHWAVANASISHGPDGLGALGFTPFDNPTMPLPLEFDAPASHRVLAGLKEDLAPHIRDTFGHSPVTLKKLQSATLNAGVMATTDHLTKAILSATEDREIDVLTASGNRKRPGAKLNMDDQVRVPEAPPLLALMGIGLRKK